MSELPRNQSLMAMQIGDVNELLEKPFHLKSVSQNICGAYHAVGLAVGKSWLMHRQNVALAFPFVAEADPTDATEGTSLLAYPQARIWLDFTAPNGDERLTFRIWHRHVAYDDTLSFGPWTMWAEINNARGRREYLGSGNFHRHIYIQLVGYGPGTATATAVTVWVAGAEGIPGSLDMDVNLDAGNIDVQIEAIPDDFGEKADSAIMAGTTDGIVPQAAGGNPTGTFAFRVMPDGRSMPWLAEPSLSILANIGDSVDLIADTNSLVRTMTYGLERAAAKRLARSPYQPGFRKVMGIDGGNATVTSLTTISFTGVNLSGRLDKVYNLTTGTEHDILSVVDPVPPAAGTITLRQPLWATTNQVLIPYLAVPHAYSTTTDAIRSHNIAPEWSHYVESTLLISQTSAPANNTYQFGPIPCLDYSRPYFEIVWATAGTRTCSFKVYGKMNPAAWPAAGTIPAAYCIDALIPPTAGSTAWGAAATGGTIVAYAAAQLEFDSLMVEMTTLLTDANNTTVTGYYGLSGNAR